jgi:hypothetical protein
MQIIRMIQAICSGTEIAIFTPGNSIILCIENFIACFFVLYFISFFMKGITYFDEKPLPPPEDPKKPEEEKQDFMLPLIK